MKSLPIRSAFATNPPLSASSRRWSSMWYVFPTRVPNAAHTTTGTLTRLVSSCQRLTDLRGAISSTAHLLRLEIELPLAEQPDAGISDIRIIQLPFAVLDLLQSRIQSRRRAVRPAGDHRLNHICHSDYLGLQVDSVAFQSGWVAGPVQPLMVLMNNVGNGAGEIDGFEYLVVRVGVSLHHRELHLAQLPWLGQNLRRNEHLAQIMEERSDVDHPYLFTAQAHLPTYSAGQLTHSLLVAGCVGVFLL